MHLLDFPNAQPQHEVRAQACYLYWRMHSPRSVSNQTIIYADSVNLTNRASAANMCAWGCVGLELYTANLPVQAKLLVVQLSVEVFAPVTYQESEFAGVGEPCPAREVAFVSSNSVWNTLFAASIMHVVWRQRRKRPRCPNVPHKTKHGTGYVTWSASIGNVIKQ